MRVKKGYGVPRQPVKCNNTFTIPQMLEYTTEFED